MISKKYLDDYKLEIKTDDKGKVTKKYRYDGKYYRFDLLEESTKKFRIELLIYIVGILIAFFVPLFVYSTLTRVFYVVIPYITLLIPIYLLLQAIYYLFRNNGKLKREEKEKSFDRLKGIPYFMLFLLLMEIVAQIVGYAEWENEIGRGDYILSGATFIVLLFTTFILLKTRKVSIETIKKIESK